MHAQCHMESHMIRVCVHGESSSVSVMLEDLSECSRSSMTHLHTHTHTQTHTRVEGSVSYYNGLLMHMYMYNHVYRTLFRYRKK